MSVCRRNFLAYAGGLALAGGIGAPFRLAAASPPGQDSQSFADPYEPPPEDPLAYRHPVLASRSSAPVASAIALAIDTSASITDELEYPFQCEMYARSLTPGFGFYADGSPRQSLVEEAICHKAGNKAVAVCVVDFGSRPMLRIPYVDLRADDPHLKWKMLGLAQEIRTLPRRETGSTMFASLLKYSRGVIGYCPWPITERRMLDICSDGTAQDFAALYSEREALAEMGVTINALAIGNPDEDLGSYYARNLVTRRETESRDGIDSMPGYVWSVARKRTIGAKGVLAPDLNEAVRAMKMKISIEVAGIEDLGRIAGRGLARNGTLRRLYPGEHSAVLRAFT